MTQHPHTAFVWSTRGFTFEIDERVDPDLFAAAAQTWSFLDETLNGLRFEWNSGNEWASRMLLLYFAARIHGVSVAVPMLLAQRLGREAIMAARSQYEYFIKMLYFDHRHEEAGKIFRELEAHDYVFLKKAGVDVSNHWSDEGIAKLESVGVKDLNFTGAVNALRADEGFLKLAGGDNPFAVWFFKNLEPAFNVHWRYGSTIVHASPVDLNNVILPVDDVHFMINVDSRMKAPNKMIADAAQRCFSAMGMIRWRFGLDFTDAHIRWSQAFGAITDRHKDEPADRRSMHD